MTILGEHLRVYLMQYGQLVSVTPEYETAEWDFELILDRESFNSIPNRLKIGAKVIPSSCLGGDQPVGRMAYFAICPLSAQRSPT